MSEKFPKSLSVYMDNWMNSSSPVGYVPSTLERTDHGVTTFDLYSRLFDDRIIILGDQVNHYTAMNIVAMMLYLDAKADNKAKKPIYLYIDSPGGSVMDGLAIIDTMNYIKSPVHTVVTGLAASMGAVIACCGEKGHRVALPHSEIMIHQPLGGAQGQSTDMEIAVEHIKRLRTTLYDLIGNASGKTVDEIAKASDRDNWMTAEEAKKFGLIDKVEKNAP